MTKSTHTCMSDAMKELNATTPDISDLFCLLTVAKKGEPGFSRRLPGCTDTMLLASERKWLDHTGKWQPSVDIGDNLGATLLLFLSIQGDSDPFVESACRIFVAIVVKTISPGDLWPVVLAVLGHVALLGLGSPVAETLCLALLGKVGPPASPRPAKSIIKKRNRELTALASSANTSKKSNSMMARYTSDEKLRQL